MHINLKNTYLVTHHLRNKESPRSPYSRKAVALRINYHWQFHALSPSYIAMYETVTRST